MACSFIFDTLYVTTIFLGYGFGSASGRLSWLSVSFTGHAEGSPITL